MEQILAIVRELRFFGMVVTAFMSKTCPNIFVTKVCTLNDEIFVKTETYKNLTDFDVAYSRLASRLDTNCPKLTGFVGF